VRVHISTIRPSARRLLGRARRPPQLAASVFSLWAQQPNTPLDVVVLGCLAGSVPSPDGTLQQRVNLHKRFTRAVYASPAAFMALRARKQPARLAGPYPAARFLAFRGTRCRIGTTTGVKPICCCTWPKRYPTPAPHGILGRWRRITLLSRINTRCFPCKRLPQREDLSVSGTLGPARPRQCLGIKPLARQLVLDDGQTGGKLRNQQQLFIVTSPIRSLRSRGERQSPGCDAFNCWRQERL
jgi:hypothetical protein